MSLKLSNYFKGIGAKRLSAVEVHPQKSNQHELNGITKFREIFGNEKKSLLSKFVYLSDKNSEEETIQLIEDNGSTTWYDARENHETRTEFRLYYSSNEAIKLASERDLLILGLKPNNDLIIIIAEKDSTVEAQIKWLFQLDEVDAKFTIRNYEQSDKELSFSDKRILESIGIEILDTNENYLEEMLSKYKGDFPDTKTFSAFARSKSNDIDAVNNPDETIIKWFETEDLLFKTLEKHIVSIRLREGFGKVNPDVDQFINFSLQVHNRRKSRAGRAFENHLEEIFKLNKIQYSRGKKTEKNNKPDFIFPGIEHYKESAFNTSLLTMLGVKTTAKDRWRQILPEANKIWPKHLITLESPISVNQTNEMKEQNVKLVIPQSLIPAYSSNQQKEILNFKTFIDLVIDKQSKIT